MFGGSNKQIKLQQHQSKMQKKCQLIAQCLNYINKSMKMLRISLSSEAGMMLIEIRVSPSTSTLHISLFFYSLVLQCCSYTLEEGKTLFKTSCVIKVSVTIKISLDIFHFVIKKHFKVLYFSNFSPQTTCTCLKVEILHNADYLQLWTI